jgi:serine/threonine protein kinase
MIFFLMVYADESVSIAHRHEVALKVVDSGRKFRFRTKHGWLSDEAVDFLGRTLVRDQRKRMNWEELLKHPLFSRKFRQLPEEYNSVEVDLADIKEVVANLK